MPRPVADILEYLAERRIHVAVRDGRPRLVRHPDVPQDQFEAAVGRVLPDIVARREELLAFLRPPPAEPPRVGSVAWRRLPPCERRRLLVARAFDLAASAIPPGHVWWFSRYTMGLAVADAPERVPLEATRISVKILTPGYFAPVACYGRPSTGDDAEWVEGPIWAETASWELPWARTPPGFRDTATYPHPPEWRPGPGFRPYIPTKAARSKAWREMWRVDVVYRDRGSEDD